MFNTVNQMLSHSLVVYDGSPPLASSVAKATAKRPQSFTPVCFGPIPAVITMLAPKTFNSLTSLDQLIHRENHRPSLDHLDNRLMLQHTSGFLGNAIFEGHMVFLCFFFFGSLVSPQHSILQGLSVISSVFVSIFLFLD